VIFLRQAATALTSLFCQGAESAQKHAPWQSVFFSPASRLAAKKASTPLSRVDRTVKSS
jgi:hypothetical protein